jgi:protoporphyrinogen/coproporphyrinogen III oxidase
MSTTVVAGGGTAGLAAAYTLEKARVDCTVLEKRDFSGGRIHGVVEDGFTLDLGAQFLFTRYGSTFKLMRDLGIEDQLVWFKKPLGILRDGTVHVMSPVVKDNLLHPASVLKFRPLSKRGMRKGPGLFLRLVRLGKKLDFDDALKAIELDGVSIADYIRRDYGDEILEYLIQPVIGALTLGEPEDVSAAYGMGLLWYGIKGLGTLKKGIGFLADSLAQNVSDLRLNTAVSKVVIEKKKVRGVEIGRGKSKEFIEADNVICCTTANVAAKILKGLPSKMTDVLSDVKSSSSVHAMFGVTGKPLGDLYGIAFPRREGLCMPGLVENTSKYPGYAPPGCGIMHTYTFGKYSQEMMDWDDERVRERMVQEIQMVVPRFPDEQSFFKVFRWPEAVGLSSPGQITAIQRLKVALKEYEGLHLAGEYMGLPSVESAIDSGIRAAKSVARGS